MDVDHACRVRLGEAERLGLLVVVLEDERPDGVRHLHEQLVALLLREVARLDDGVSRILMFTSRSEQSTPPELSIASVLTARPPARTRSPALRYAQVAALADHLRAQLGGVHPHRVVGLVAGVGVRLVPAFT